MQNIFDKFDCTRMLIKILSDPYPNFDTDILNGLLDVFLELLDTGNHKV